jgi:TonB family protein
MRMKPGVGFLALTVIAVTGVFAQDQSGATSGMPQTPPAQASADASGAAAKPMRIRVGGNVASAKLTHMVPPVYPQPAKTAHVSGTVVLHCIVAKYGTMAQVEYVSGPPLLLKATIDAVRQWTYQPTLLNGNPVEVDTVVRVVFALDGKPPADAKKQDDSAGPVQDSKPVPLAASPAEAPTPIDPQLKADILRLMDVTHFKEKQEEAMRKVFESMRPTLLATIPATPNREKILDTYIDKLVGLLQTEDSTKRLAALYAQYLTDADVKAALAFYDTPAGQHYLESSQKLLPEAMMIGQRIARDNIPAILKDICKQYSELEGEAKFCGPPDPTKKSLLLNVDPLLGN